MSKKILERTPTDQLIYEYDEHGILISIKEINPFMNDCYEEGDE